ncbi:MAG: hypothetical protein HY509_03805 [Acidobacteria bacterium]|nr:hypothetical protein [Acidobacteriota bacterium]
MTRTCTLLSRTVPFLLLGLTAGCGAVGNTSPRTLTSTDGLTRVLVPPGWAVRQDLNDEADLQVGDVRNNAFLIVLSESKGDFEAMDYLAHSRLTREGFLQSLATAQVTAGPFDLDIHGRRAVKYELSATVNGVRIVYFHVTVDGTRAFHQILAWTVPSQLERNQQALDFLVNSFQEVG